VSRYPQRHKFGEPFPTDDLSTVDVPDEVQTALELQGISGDRVRRSNNPNVYWVLHNFVRVHFTTKHVPAVALGIIEQGLSLAEIFSILCVWN
jgi:hypothetical protein